MPYSLPTGAAGRCEWAVWLYMSSHTGQYSGAHTTKHTPCIKSLPLYARATMEELQAEFTRALLAMNQLGHFAQGNLHTVCSNTSHDCCIAILPDKRFMCNICPLNQMAVDSTVSYGPRGVDRYPYLKA